MNKFGKLFLKSLKLNLTDLFSFTLNEEFKRLALLFFAKAFFTFTALIKCSKEFQPSELNETLEKELIEILNTGMGTGHVLTHSFTVVWAL